MISISSETKNEKGAKMEYSKVRVGTIEATLRLHRWEREPSVLSLTLVFARGVWAAADKAERGRTTMSIVICARV